MASQSSHRLRGAPHSPAGTSGSRRVNLFPNSNSRSYLPSHTSDASMMSEFSEASHMSDRHMGAQVSGGGPASV